ncbi:MAG: HAMP domain-containing histidine kinase [Desulfobacterales bacterium]|jgi:signal transduction histidine kinase|nr:HAMP domain-containing histidine kinase [Desulfobacterales bacterium]
MSGSYIMVVDEGGELLYADEGIKDAFESKSPGHYRFEKIPLGGKGKAPTYLIKVYPPEEELIKFFSVFIHEFKNPLGAIRALAQSLEAKFRSDTVYTDKIKVYTGRIISEIDRLNSLLASVKYISRPAIRFLVNFNLSEVVQEVVDLYREELSLKGIGIQLELKKRDIMFRGNPDSFHQILSNLIKNAHEALIGKQEGEIKVGLALHNQTIQIEVIDNGKGIPEEVLTSLGKKPFVTTKPYGMGLGLFVVETLTKGYGGSLEFAQGPGGSGTRVTISFPLLRMDEV